MERVIKTKKAFFKNAAKNYLLLKTMYNKQYNYFRKQYTKMAPSRLPWGWSRASSSMKPTEVLYF